jgi:ketosteroid isomerase-like protein
LKRLIITELFCAAIILGCHPTERRSAMVNQQETEVALAELRSAYAAFDRGDIDSAVRFLDPHVEWEEPSEFPGGSTYYGIDGAKRYLTRSRAAASQVISTPERFIPAGNRIVVFVHARMLPKDSSVWQDVGLADVYTFEDGKVTKMRAFANREDALHWVGINDPRKQEIRSPLKSAGPNCRQRELVVHVIFEGASHTQRNAPQGRS